MKQFRLLCVLCLLCCALPLFSAESGFGRGFFYGSAGSGGAFYGSSAVTDRNTALTGDNFSHIVLAVSGGGALILAEPLYFTLGVDSVLDFYMGGTKYANNLDFSLDSGIRVYPGLAGFAFSVEYCLGSRTDIIKLEKAGDGSKTTPWGNGFRFAAEYDFTYQTNGFAPTVGAAWKHMPRGGETSDDYITVFFKLGFRSNP
jgi:hypothetical protein